MMVDNGERVARTEGYDLSLNDLHNHGGAWSTEDHDRLYPTCAVMYGTPLSGGDAR